MEQHRNICIKFLTTHVTNVTRATLDVDATKAALDKPAFLREIESEVEL